MENILFLVVLFFLFSNLQWRRKKRESQEKSLPRGREEGKKMAGSVSPSEQTEMKAPEEPSPESANYEEFRRKLRNAWHMPGEAGQENAEEKEEMILPPDLDTPPYEEKAPIRPAAAAPPKEMIPYAGQASSSGERNVTSIFRKEREKAPPAALLPHWGWTEADVERWVLYDAVLGEPRSRRPWMPPQRRQL